MEILKEESRINIVPFLYGFFISMSFTIWLDYYVFLEKSLPGLYLIDLIIAGIAFWRYLWTQVVVAGLITIIRYRFDSNGDIEIIIQIFQWLTYVLAIVAVSTLIKFYLRERDNTLNLTITLAKSLDSRDAYTAFHSENVAHYALCIAREMKLSKKQIKNIYIGGLLHDIGKIGVPESILTKPSRLTNDEYETIKQHPTIGYDPLSS